ncbi:MAG: cupin [Cyanobacteria bacterium P01_G01_bin.49]
MNLTDWLVTNNGLCQRCPVSDNWQWQDKIYRLYRFLTNVEDILEKTQNEQEILQFIRPLVRRLLASSYWIQGEYIWPDAKQGWSVLNLYDDIDFSLTLQTVVWLPGQASTIHNHGTWGLVAIISGEEKNLFWRRKKDIEHQHIIEKVGEKIIKAGDIISFTSDAIHSIEVVGEEPVISFNLYGKTNYEQRWKFDQINHTARNF